jgi:hypothetical protein
MLCILNAEKKHHVNQPRYTTGPCIFEIFPVL